MGQAKLRGTFEERKSFAIKRNKKEAEERKNLLIEKARRINFNPAQANKRRVVIAASAVMASISKGL